VDAALRTVHLLVAIVWVRRTVALVVVAVPPVQRFEGEARARTLRALGRRWRRYEGAETRRSGGSALVTVWYEGL